MHFEKMEEAAARFLFFVLKWIIANPKSNWQKSFSSQLHYLEKSGGQNAQQNGINVVTFSKDFFCSNQIICIYTFRDQRKMSKCLTYTYIINIRNVKLHYIIQYLATGGDKKKAY